MNRSLAIMMASHFEITGLGRWSYIVYVSLNHEYVRAKWPRIHVLFCVRYSAELQRDAAVSWTGQMSPQVKQQNYIHYVNKTKQNCTL